MSQGRQTVRDNLTGLRHHNSFSMSHNRGLRHRHLEGKHGDGDVLLLDRQQLWESSYALNDMFKAHASEPTMLLPSS